MRSYKTEAIILKRRNSGESDRILTVFTKTNGKIRIKAKGVRKIQSRRSAHVEVFNHAFLNLYHGQGFPILTEATTLNDHYDVKQDLTKVGFAYHMCELVDGLCAEEQENRRIFYLLSDALKSLASSENTALVIHEFEVQLLTSLGFWNSNRPLAHEAIDMFVENILEKRLKSKRLFAKLQ